MAHVATARSLRLFTVIAVTTAAASLAPNAVAQAGAPGQHLSFDQAVERAVGGSLRGKLAEDELAAQTARKNQAQTGYGPHVEAGYTDVHFDKSIHGALGPQQFLIRDSNSQTGYIQASQPITGLLVAYERSKLERAQEEINEAGLDAARIEAAFGAAIAYRKAQEAQEIERIAQSSIAATESQTHDARAMIQSGRLIKSDLLKIEIARQEALSAYAHAKAGRKKAIANLLYILNAQADANSVALDPLGSPGALKKALAATNQMVLTQNTEFDKTLAKASEARLDVKQAELAKEKARRLKRLTNYRYIPKVSAIAKWDKDYGTPPFGTVPFNRTLGFTATWDIWDNGLRLFAEREAAAVSQQAETSLEMTKDKLRLELESDLADLQAANEALAAAEATVTQAEDAYRLDKARFSSGLVTATDLVLAETLQTRARGTLATAMTEVDVLNLLTQKALGETRPHAVLQ